MLAAATILWSCTSSAGNEACSLSDADRGLVENFLTYAPYEDLLDIKLKILKILDDDGECSIPAYTETPECPVFDGDTLTEKQWRSRVDGRAPSIIRFKDGAKSWTDPSLWQFEKIKRDYGSKEVKAGQSDLIVRNSGSGGTKVKLADYIERMLSPEKQKDTKQRPLYVFDGDFFPSSNLARSLKMPAFLSTDLTTEGTLWFLGQPNSSVAFHRHGDSWCGVVYGRKHWYLYPPHQTPPGGFFPSYGQLDWIDRVLPRLSGPERANGGRGDRPLECVQRPGEILYVPEGWYHAVVNEENTVAVAYQKNAKSRKGEYFDYEDFRGVTREMADNGLSPEEQDQEMEREFQAAEMQCFGCSEISVRRGQFQSNLGRSDAAIVHMKKALELNPLDAITHATLGIELARMGKNEEAKEALIRAHQMSPKQLDIVTGLANFLANNQNDGHSAQEVLKAALKASMIEGGDETGVRDLLKFLTKLKE